MSNALAKPHHLHTPALYNARHSANSIFPRPTGVDGPDPATANSQADAPTHWLVLSATLSITTLLYYRTTGPLILPRTAGVWRVHARTCACGSGKKGSPTAPASLPENARRGTKPLSNAEITRIPIASSRSVHEDSSPQLGPTSHLANSLKNLRPRFFQPAAGIPIAIFFLGVH